MGHSLVWKTLAGYSCVTLLLGATDSRRFCIGALSLPQWHRHMEMHFSPKPRKTAWRIDIANIIWPRGALQTRYSHATPSLVDTASHPAPQRHDEFTLARGPFPYGTDPRKRTFPPRPRKTAWHSDITDVIWPHGVPQTTSGVLKSTCIA